MTVRRRAAIAAVLCMVLAGCGSMSQEQRIRQEMLRGDPEQALVQLEQAMRANPGNARYRQTYERERALLVNRFVADGDLQRSAQRHETARSLYARALKYDPGNERAKAGIAALELIDQQNAILKQAREDIAADRLEAAEKPLRELLARNPGQREARELLNRIADRQADLQMQPAPSPALKGAFAQPITLEFRDASLKSVFEVISRSAGINFVFDRDVRSDTRINIFVRDTSLDDVVKLILMTNQLERKLLNEKTVLIYPNTPAKQKEYRELVVRSFYLANADVKQALNLVKGMVKTPDVFIDEKLNLMVVKDTPDAVRLIASLIRSMDLAEPEVMLEVEVLEIASTRLQELGVRYPEAIALGNPASDAASFVLGEDRLEAFTVNPIAVIDLKARDGDVRLLANPRIRVKNREKAKVHIGDRVPVVTTTSTANVGVSSSVSYLDVGLKLDVEPNIYLRDEVAIKVGLEVSNITDTLDLEGGTRAYELGTRNTATTLQLRDGETQILAGLISDEDRRTARKVPGLGDFPVLGRLFRSELDDRRKTEIVLLITPRIVRSLEYPQTAVSATPVGTDAAIGTVPVRIGPSNGGQVAIAPSGSSITSAGPIPRPLPPPAVGTPPPTPDGADAVDRGEAAGADDVVARAAAGGPSALMIAAPPSARGGSDIVVSLSLPPGGAAQHASAELVYDPLQLEVVGGSGAAPGRVPVRIDGSAAVRFRVLLAGGRAQLRAENVSATDAGGNPVAVSAPGPIEITVQ
ncbi:MAG: general secretion pathway protein GspD [Burkholderiales bacterium]|nr:general secretion pathway protein GspD [Burkholderiales bacterium]